MPATGLYIILIAAFGLLLLAGAGIGRARGREPSAGTHALMAALTGATVGFILMLMPVMPFILFPAVTSVALASVWTARRQWPLLGSFLLGAGGLWVVSEAWAAWNDLAGEAVSRPGWSPLPLALASAATMLGVTVLVASRRPSGPPAG